LVLHIVDEEQNLRLYCIGSSCGHAIEHPSTSADTKSQPAQGCQRNFSFIRSLEQSDHSLLWRFIHPIATGKVLSELSRNSGKSFQRERNASFVASDLLKGGGYHGSPLEDQVSNHLYIGNVSDLLLEFFICICLSQIKKTISLSSDSAVRDKLERGLDMTNKKWGIIIGASNNHGSPHETYSFCCNLSSS
jgi:hypothetical protein